MNASLRALELYVTRNPVAAIATYAVVLLACLLLIGFSLSEMVTRRQEVSQLSETLAQIQGRGIARPGRDVRENQARPEGSPFLEGQTVTVASAALLQRIADAVLRVGGTMLSSQVELEGTNAKDGFVTVVATSELEEPKLQALLYDLEAGMPFLFIEQLVAQLTTTSGSQRMRLLLSVSGQWQAPK
jgi:general secretion pathway protein M